MVNLIAITISPVVSLVSIQLANANVAYMIRHLRRLYLEIGVIQKYHCGPPF